MLSKIKIYFKNRPFLILLVIILAVISDRTIKGDFFLMGWDNYSSYFNLKTNLFRTLFATWRESRGLGVPSDAEVTDMFRLVFDAVAGLFVPERCLDQVYYCTALWLGVLGMYALSKIIFRKVIRGRSELGLDLFGGLAGFLYLFNLNTLSVFYSPIIPFTNRFYALPLTLWALLKFFDSKSKKSLVMLIVTVIASSGSFVTPTVLITTVIAYGIFGLFQLGIKKTVGMGLMFGLLNAFWIFPFLNYTANKSEIIPLARTFVEINESTLNRPASIFSLEKQAEMYPSFLDMSFPSINKTSVPIHPLLNEYKSDLGRWALAVFPVLYVLGIVFLAVNWKKYKMLGWAPVWILVFLFLSCKEFGPAGGVYSWLKEKVPYFEILFRISDTKFHAYINLAGSLMGSMVIGNLIIILLKRKLAYPIIGAVAVGLGLYGWYFRTYFDGNMIGYYVYTKLPSAYQEIAKEINSNKRDSGRLLHLPMSSQHHYWRSFNWGYLGSAFFNFMIDVPYIDKTFEPGSMENVYLNSKINQLLDSHYKTSTESQKKLESDKFMELMGKSGVKYVMVDHSITSEVNTRDIYYNTKQYEVRAEAMMKRLKESGRAKLVKNYPINLKELYPAYEKLYPVTESKLPENLPEQTSIDLYELSHNSAMFGFIKEAKVVADSLENLGETQIVDEKETVLQHESETGVLIPFEQQGAEVTSMGGMIKIDLGRWALAVFPVLYVLGIVFLAVNWKKYKMLGWAPVWILVFLFLSCKEFGPAGGVYSWLKEKVPYFEILFRISDTKFHAFLSQFQLGLLPHHQKDRLCSRLFL